MMFNHLFTLLLLVLAVVSLSTVRAAPPSYFTSINALSTFTSTNLTTGDVMSSVSIESGLVIDTLLECSGNDYIVLTHTYSNGYNVTRFNASSGETTYIGGFSIPSNPILSSQYQSSSISNGLVFTTYCPTVTPMLTIIDLDNQTTETITFKGTTCDMYAFGQYDNSTQTFYMVGWTDKKASSLTFSTYSMITKEITNVEFEYNLKYIGHVQTIYLFESQLYACIIQFTYAEVLLLDFETKSYKSIFKLDIAFPGGQFIFDPRGYIVGMMVEDDQAQYGVYTIDLRTLTTTQHTIPVKDYQTLSNIEAGDNAFCAR